MSKSYPKNHILIVEDEEIIRSSLRKLLERHDFLVSDTVSIKSARELFDLSAFDLIISDLRLPGQMGTDLIALAKPVPVLIMTSYASLRSAVDTMRQGAADYIAKPFDHQEIMVSVRRIIDAPKKPSDVSTDLSLEGYFTRFVLQNQEHMSETDLAKKLGISRKSLWQRRKKLNINRKKTVTNP
jgi:DNA-binding NtrC family response regulator